MLNARKIWAEVEAYWECCCAQYPQILAQAGSNVSPYYDLRLWTGKPLPDLEGGSPFRLSFEAFLGGEYRHMGPDEGGLPTHFPLDRLVEEDVAVWGEYVIGQVVYSASPERHRKLEAKYSKGWAASFQGKIVGCDRIGWVWVDPEHRGKGLGLRLEVEKWTQVPYLTIYMKYAFRQIITPDGMALQKRLYEELIRRKLLVDE